MLDISSINYDNITPQRCPLRPGDKEKLLTHKEIVIHNIMWIMHFRFVAELDEKLDTTLMPVR